MDKEIGKMEEIVKEFSERHHIKDDGRFYEHIRSTFISCDEAVKTLTMAYDTTKWSGNLLGIVHGGVLTGAVDQCMGILAYWAAPGEMIPLTVSMHTNYLRPVTAGRRLFVQAQVTSAGRTLQSIAAKAWTEDGSPDKPVLTATATYITKG